MIFNVLSGHENHVISSDVIRSPHDPRSLVRTPARTIPRISQLEIHSVYQAVIGT